MNKEYVQQYVELEKHHWWFLVRKKIILQFLKKYIPNKTNRILNIGVAGGWSSIWLSELGEVMSVETDLSFIDLLKSNKIPVINASITDMPFEDNYFDLVCAFDVIEHVLEDDKALKEIERVCKKNGIICITVPAMKVLWSGHDVVNNHYRRYTQKSLLSLMGQFPLLQKRELSYFNSLLFIPILIARKISVLFSKDSDKLVSDFTLYKTTGVIHSVLNFIFSIELSLLKWMHFPMGVSLIGIWKKQ